MSEPRTPSTGPRSARRLRALDLALIIGSAPVWVPAIAALAAAVVLTSGRPVFFVQTRIGQGHEPFPMIKFRSMKNGENPLIPDPDRVTAIGRFLRRTSLDELPQLLNVISGAMSLVGPRPMLPGQVAALDPHQEQRLLVRPGMTGLAQVNGRNSLSWDERFEYDVEWARTAGLRRHLAILTQTASTVVGGAGVAGHSATDRVVAIDLAARGEVVDLSIEQSPSSGPRNTETAA